MTSQEISCQKVGSCIINKYQKPAPICSQQSSKHQAVSGLTRQSWQAARSLQESKNTCCTYGKHICIVSTEARGAGDGPRAPRRVHRLHGQRDVRGGGPGVARVHVLAAELGRHADIDRETFERATEAKGNLRAVGGAMRTDDVANAVLFLASDDARHISGHNLILDGGMSVAVNPAMSVFKD
ncbi:hypothetical protein PR202_ga20614 [Eleusine coracana subsp. coracana]|uniref:Sex determination protein tasselseed-2 n=1 Tax=Eleusine coracana subsp. coracana TaxID=191504 RepID=A0AAV5CYR0_ELECO|nr:hypothetical protein PR202_ga20614 [Eleusine coracana subsp. coracana]